MRVVYVYRAKNPLFFSLERVFQLVRAGLGKTVEESEIRLPHLGFNLKNFVFLKNAIKKEDDHTIYHVTGDCTYVVSVLPAKRTIFTVHDIGFLKDYSGWKFKLIRWLYIKMPANRARMITTISEQTRQEVIHYSNCDPEKVRVIPNPVDLSIQYHPRVFNTEKPRLLFLGSTPNKNLDRAIEALKGVTCQLWIVGKPSQSQVDEMKKNGIDFYTEHGLTNQEMADRYSSADIVFFPTLYEGFGLPILEGFRAGRAVLTSNVQPMMGISAGAACLVDPLNADSIKQGVQKLVADEGYRNNLIQQGFEVANRYEPKVIAGLYEQVYQQILA